MEQRFSQAQLSAIINASLIYMCACPAQVAEQIQHLRRLYEYQENCRLLPDTDDRVHDLISHAASKAHETLEACMDQILTLEGWDLETLVMPDGLRKVRDDLIQNG